MNSVRRRADALRDRKSQMNTYRVQAYNTAHSSENKIHDDAVARRFGFSGALVPGVDVYAYMMHLPVERWGRVSRARERAMPLHPSCL